MRILTDTTSVAHKIADGIGTVLDELGKRFGATGAHLWQLLIKQVYVHAVVCGVEWSIIFVLTLVLVLFTRKFWAENLPTEDRYGTKQQNVLSIVLLVFSFIMIITTIAFAFGTAETITQAVMNPEYQALSNVLDLLHGSR